MYKTLSATIKLLIVLTIVTSTGWANIHPQVRIKDLVDIDGVRSNQLSGVGVVMGLQGTGDKSNMSIQALRNLMRRFGVTLTEKDVKSKNVAVVAVTATLPPFVRPGQTVDVTISAIGDAKSLQGGVLLQTPLQAANGAVYAVAQGPVLVGGFSAGRGGSSVAKNVVTVGQIGGGAIVERDVPTMFSSGGYMSLLLRNPDFTTARRVADAINGKFGNIATPLDAGRVAVQLPGAYASSPSAFVADMENMRVTPDIQARVVVNERTGTVVMGGNVQISSVAVAHGDLTVRIDQDNQVSQPNPFSQGVTTPYANNQVNVEEQRGSFIKMDSTTTVDQLVDAVNSVGATPRDVIGILQAIDRAGALHGELVIM